MNTTQTDKATVERWFIDGEYIVDQEQSPRFRVMGTAPYNQAWMESVVRAVNEHAALVAVAEAANDLLTKANNKVEGQHFSDYYAKTRQAISTLAAVRGEGGGK